MSATTLARQLRAIFGRRLRQPAAVHPRTQEPGIETFIERIVNEVAALLGVFQLHEPRRRDTDKQGSK